MPYRADVDALEARAAVLERELADARKRAQEAATLKETERELERELAETRRLLAASAAARRGSLLDDVKIATPCSARWDDMIGDDAVRFCSKCQKDVFNLSAMTRDDAESLLRERAGAMCARLYRRTDGTVITADCPVGVRAKRVRRLAMVVGGGLMAGAAATALAGTRAMGAIAPPCHAHAQVEMGEPPVPMAMGSVAVMGGVSAPPESAIPSATPPAMMGKVQAHPPPHR